MTEQRHATGGWFARWRQHRRAKRQRALEREYFAQERLSPTTRAYTDGDNHARRWTSFLAAVAAVAAVDMTRDEAMAEVKRRRVADPDATWVATQRASEWTVARIGLAPTKQTNTETKPPAVAPRDDPHSPVERGAWFAGLG